MDPGFILQNIASCCRIPRAVRSCFGQYLHVNSGVAVAVVVTVAAAVVAVRGRSSWGGRSAAAATTAGAAGSVVFSPAVEGAGADEDDGWLFCGRDRSLVFLVSPDSSSFSWRLSAVVISCASIAMSFAMSRFMSCPMPAAPMALLLLSVLKCCWLLR